MSTSDRTTQADRMAQQTVRALFVTPTWMATGETAAALVLADSIVAGGGEAWFLASTPAAQIVRPKYGDRVQEMTGDLASNQHHWRRMIEEIDPSSPPAACSISSKTSPPTAPSASPPASRTPRSSTPAKNAP